MDRTEAIAIIRRGLGFRDDLEDEIVAALKQAQRLLEAGTTLPWFLIEEDDTISLSAGDQNFTLPEGFIRPVYDQRPRYTPATSDEPFIVPFKSLEDATTAFGGEDAAGPQVAVLRNTVLTFFPVPDDDYELTWSYYKKADVLDVGVENAWLEHAPELLCGDAGLLIAGPTSDRDAIAYFTALRAAGMQQAFKATILREQEHVNLQMGSDN